MMSETNMPARQRRANPPPLISLNCLRTVFSSAMFAPAALK